MFIKYVYETNTKPTSKVQPLCVSLLFLFISVKKNQKEPVVHRSATHVCQKYLRILSCIEYQMLLS